MIFIRHDLKMTLCSVGFTMCHLTSRVGTRRPSWTAVWRVTICASVAWYQRFLCEDDRFQCNQSYFLWCLSLLESKQSEKKTNNIILCTGLQCRKTWAFRFFSGASWSELQINHDKHVPSDSSKSARKNHKHRRMTWICLWNSWF